MTGVQTCALPICWQGRERPTQRVLGMHSAEIRDALLCQPLGTVFKSVAGSYLDRPHDPSNIRLFVYINRANAIAEGAMQGNLSTWSLSALKFGFRRAVAPILTFPRCDGRRDLSARLQFSLELQPRPKLVFGGWSHSLPGGIRPGWRRCCRRPGRY